MIAVFDTHIVIDALNGLPEADAKYGRYERVLISRRPQHLFAIA